MLGLNKIFTLLVVLCIALVGCSEIGKTTEEVKTEGYILEVGGSGILVAEDMTSEEYKAIKDTAVSDLYEKGLSLIYFSNDDTSNLRVGNKVEIWFDGTVAESYPAQARATKIVLKE